LSIFFYRSESQAKKNRKNRIVGKKKQKKQEKKQSRGLCLASMFAFVLCHVINRLDKSSEKIVPLKHLNWKRPDQNFEKKIKKQEIINAIR